MRGFKREAASFVLPPEPYMKTIVVSVEKFEDAVRGMLIYVHMVHAHTDTLTEAGFDKQS